MSNIPVFSYQPHSAAARAAALKYERGRELLVRKPNLSPEALTDFERVGHEVHVRAEALLARATPGLPALGANGMLPAGVHDATLGELRTRFGTSTYRNRLLDRLELALRDLRDGGVKDVVIGGSFLTDKQLPGDIDLAYIEHDDADPLALKRAVADARKRGQLSLPAGAGESKKFLGVYSYDKVSKDLTIPGRGPVSLLELFSSSREGVERGMVRLHLGSLGALGAEHDALAAAARLVR